MTVEQFAHKNPSKSATKASNSIAKQTTTLETPVKVLEEKSNSQQSSECAAKIVFKSRLTKELCRLRSFFIYDRAHT